MTNEEIFEVWSPDDSVWSTWVKPVLFAQAGTAVPLPPGAETAPEVGWAAQGQDKFTLVLDLPIDEGVWLGLALTRCGYRPVPLYNALPLPFGVSAFDSETGRPVAAVDMLPIVNALRHGAERLLHLKLSPNFPPAFLLDANRQGDRPMLPDEFDNRSICFTTDFPSGNFLLTHGIERVLLVQRARIEPQTDLAHVLRRWQDAGLALERIRIEEPTAREAFQVDRPSWYRAMFQRALASLGLRRALLGGFGAWIPESSAGG